MINVNKVLNDLLMPLWDEGISVYYQYPETFTELPAVSYYDLITAECFRADNSEQTQMSRAQIDVWAEREAQPGEIAEKINAFP